jgi:hypothetical protein
MVIRVRPHRDVRLGGSGRLVSVLGTRSGDGTTPVVVGTPYGRVCPQTPRADPSPRPRHTPSTHPTGRAGAVKLAMAVGMDEPMDSNHRVSSWKGT